MRARPAAQRGMTLIEVVVVLAIVTILLLVIYSMMDQTLHATMFNESHNDLAIMTQRAVNTIQTEVIEGKQVFEEDATGIAYRNALQIPASSPQWSSTLMPVIEPSTTLAPDDASTRHTGNALLMVRSLAPLSILYDDDNNASTPKVELVADRYRFEYYFLSPVNNRMLDLIECRSVEYADYFQLSGLPAPVLSQIATALINAGITRAWNPGQPLASAFYALSGATDGTFDAALNNPTIAVARTKSLLPELRGGRISGRIDYSIAFNRTPIAVFAQANGNFPSGFEVKIAGPAGNRKVMTRVLLMAHYKANTWETQQGYVVTAARF